MSILITGGTGSFGNACARKLLDRGHTRICIYSRGEHAQAESESGLATIKGFAGLSGTCGTATVSGGL